MYAYTASRLASGKISFEQVGKLLPNEVVSIPYQKAVIEGKKIKGTIDILDVQYGNIWTNIDADLFKQLNVKVGDNLHVVIYQNKIKKYEGNMPYTETFGSVAKGKPLLYLNSLLQVSFALNMDSFSAVHKVYSGSEWTVEVSKVMTK
ncbi:MAG: SAM hydroxide adenosyltransferase [Ferruginibacter sp.]